MNKSLKNSFFDQLQKTSFLKNLILSFAIRHLKNDKNDFQFFLKEFSHEINEEAIKYPSVLNSGYKHIDRVLEFSRYFKLPPNNLILDVGAASGETPVRFAKAFPSAAVYSFEPIPVTYDLLVNETSAYANVKCIHKALGREIKTLHIHIASRITSSSLLDIEKNLPNKFWAENLKEEGTVEVQMSTLDAEIPADKKVNILKMDVQGYELEVLNGGTDTLKRTVLILVEMQNHDLYLEAPKYHDIDGFLRQRGFELYDMIPSIRQDKKLYEWDAIYVNKSLI